ncbi:MAG: cytochrome c [Hyphomicrobiaceae bacterium]
MQDPTEALPVIWDRWDEFNDRATRLVELAGELQNGATTGKAQSLATFAKIGKTCSGCHDVFRLKKDK